MNWKVFVNSHKFNVILYCVIFCSPTCIFLFFEMLGTSCWLLSFLVKNIMVSVYVHVCRDLLFFNVGVQLWPGQVCFVLHLLEFPFHPVGSSLYCRESDKEGLLWTRKSTEKQIYLLIFNLCEPQNMLYMKS